MKKHLVRKSICTILALSFLSAQVFAAPNQTLKDKYQVTEIDDTIVSEDALKDSYFTMLPTYEGVPAAKEPIKLDIHNAARTDNGQPNIKKVSYPTMMGETKEADAIVWDDAAAGYQWQFEVPETGLYQLDFRYVALEPNLDILYGLQIDGKSPYKEAESIRLKNAFTPSGEEKTNQYGDQLTMDMTHVDMWQDYSAYDLDGIFYEPLLFKLEKGNHTFTMIFRSGKIALSDINFAVPKEYKDYKSYSRSCDYPVYDGEKIHIEAEDAEYRSRKSLTSESSNDPSVTPFRIGKKTQNVLNGWSYRQGNDEITWKFTVPKDGKYKLALRVQQNYYNGSVVYRQLLIDGEVPFAEAQALPFEGTGNGFRIYTMKGNENYLFNLSAGEHTITLRATMGELKGVYESLYEINNTLNNTLKDIQTITGTNPDPNYDYELETKAPWVLEDVKTVYEAILKQAEIVEDYCNKTSEMVTTMRTYAGDLQNMVKKPILITKQMTTLVTVQSQIGGWISQLRDSPLQIDYMEFLAQDEEPENSKVSLWTRICVLFAEFINSFRGSESGDIGSSDPNTIEVWTAREREYGEVLQRMANDMFTPATGIKVNVNILGAQSVGVGSTSPLMLALVSGQAPDVAMGSDSGTPVELAIRNSGYDLSKFEDFEEVKNRFPKGAMVPLEYKGGYYALPDTMNFSILLYRKDILSGYGIQVPNTWEQMLTQTLPSLRQYNLRFGINSTTDKNAPTGSNNAYPFMSFYYQNGGKLYKDGNIDSTLDSDLAFQTFKQYTDLYLQYDLEYSQNFYNMFSTGQLPMAMGDLYDYLQVDVAAPGIAGKWEIAPALGTKKEDGTIDRSCCGAVTTSMIFDNNGKEKQAWEFLKWWTSDEVQIQFASEIESIVGTSARWFSANKNALLSLNWSDQAKSTVEEMLKWYNNIPNVLGGYMTVRSISQAFIRVVVNGSQKQRDALEQAYKEINAELIRKNREYGVIE